MRYAFILILLMGFYGVKAQENYIYINWDYNVPLSNTDWLNTSSPNGGKVGYRHFIGGNKVSVGLDLNWATFDKYLPTETFQNTNGALTTDYFNYIYNYGGVISGQYYFPLGEEQLVMPYVGLGLGANYNQYSRFYNIYEDSDNAWGFLARPEAGLLVRFGSRRTLGAMAAVHYDYSTNKSEVFNYNNFSTFGFQLGVVLMSR